MKKLLLVLTAAIAGVVVSAPQAQQTDDAVVIEQSTRTLQYNPRDYEARFNRGDAYFRTGQYEKAIADFDTLLDGTKTPLLYYKRGESYLNRADKTKNNADYQKAIDDFSSALALDAAHVYSYFLRGEAYRRSGQSAKAVVDLSKAIEFEPNNIWFYNFRGEAKFATGDYKGAIADWNKAMKLGFNDSLKKRVKAAQAKL